MMLNLQEYSIVNAHLSPFVCGQERDNPNNVALLTPIVAFRRMQVAHFGHC